MPEPTSNDKSTVNLVVLMLGAASLIGLLGIVVLVAMSKSGEAIALVSTPTAAALGALGGVLANTKSVDVKGLDELAAAASPTPSVGAVSIVTAPAEVDDAPPPGGGVPFDADLP